MNFPLDGLAWAAKPKWSQLGLDSHHACFKGRFLKPRSWFLGADTPTQYFDDLTKIGLRRLTIAAGAGIELLLDWIEVG